jgi:predicted O-methyltransferase YrrM
MHESRRQFADRLYAESHAHDQGRPRLERFRNVEPPTAELLGVLVRAVGARRILELGTSNGYSTIWLADAAEATAGAAVSVDTDERRTAMARESLAAAEFTQRIGAVAELTQTVVPVGAGLRVAVRDRS